jgi:hypothetical protein
MVLLGEDLPPATEVPSGGDNMNLQTGEYLLNMGGGDQMNLRNGDYFMNMGGK